MIKIVVLESWKFMRSSFSNASQVMKTIKDISGHMTYTKIRAGVYGDKECINLAFLESLPENIGNEIYDDCELLSFRKEGEDIYTYWGKVEAIFYENQSPGEIYFTKVGEE